MKQPVKTVSLGQELKRLREQRGWSLQAASKVTRIRVDQLALIEQDRLDAFPSQSYLRGFIRIYSKALGLDPEAVMERLEKRPEKKFFTIEDEPRHLDIKSKNKKSKTAVSLNDRAQEWGAKLVASMIAIVIIALTAVIYQTMQNSNTSEVSQTAGQLKPDSFNTTSDVSVPIVPRERLLSQNLAPTNEEPATFAQAEQTPPTSEPAPSNTTVETPVSNNGAVWNTPILRPSKILNIPPADSPLSQQKPPTLTPDQLNQRQPDTAQPHTTPPVLSQTLQPANPTRQIVNDVEPLHPQITETTTNQDFPDDQLQDVFAQEDQTIQEEVALSDEEFLRLSRQSLVAATVVNQPQPQTVTNPIITLPPGAVVARARQTQLARNDNLYEESAPSTTDTQSATNLHHITPGNPPQMQTHSPVLPEQNLANLTTPAVDTIGEALNRLRLELSKEAYVRVFINDNTTEPALDDVLPAGSAASWEGRTFYVTIRPANAATFYYNGQRYDYSGRGPENVTLRFP